MKEALRADSNLCRMYLGVLRKNIQLNDQYFIEDKYLKIIGHFGI